MLWSDQYRLGVPELDGQHMIIFSILGQVEAALAAGVSSEVACDILRGLRDFAAFHLRYEEVLMEQKGYPAVYQHALEHQWIMETLECLLEADPLTSLAGADAAVRTWFADHILTQDNEFAVYVLSQ